MSCVRAHAVASLVLVSLAACGARSTPTRPSPATVDLASGSYNLVLTMSTTGDPTCTGVGCSTASLCYGISGAAPLVAISVPAAVRVERVADAVTVRPDDATATFRMDLQIAGTALSGTASGQYRSGATTVRVDNGTPVGAAVVTGTLLAPFVSGRLTGAIDIGGTGCSNDGHRWTLTPR